MVLRVKLEIVPFGDEENVREIGRLDIFNKGEAYGDMYEYGVIDLTPGQIGLIDRKIYHERDDGAWKLVQNVLMNAPIGKRR